MDNESIAELVRKWLAGIGDVLPVEELLERIKGREQWIANEIAWRDRLNYQQLESLEKAAAEAADLRRQLAEAQEDEVIIISERDAAEKEAAELRRQLAECQERESADIAEAADLRAKLDTWQATGDAIMLAVCGRVAQLSDSDVIGVVAELRQQLVEVQELTAWHSPAKKAPPEFMPIVAYWQEDGAWYTVLHPRDSVFLPAGVADCWHTLPDDSWRPAPVCWRFIPGPPGLVPDMAKEDDENDEEYSQ